jgi:hypothetical protein
MQCHRLRAPLWLHAAALVHWRLPLQRCHQPLAAGAALQQQQHLRQLLLMQQRQRRRLAWAARAAWLQGSQALQQQPM